MSHELDRSQQELIEEQLRLHQAVRAVLPGADTPYFAHMRVETGGRVRDVLLGWRALRERGVLMIDWQSAPLAAVFFECTEGEEYEITVGEHELSGTLIERNLVGFERGELVEIITSRQTLSRRSTGTWALAGHGSSILEPRPEHARSERTAPIHVELDATQRRAVTMPAGRPVLVLGEAGCGKTTVALHRLAFLKTQADEQDRPCRAAVIVPSEGLRRFTRAMLERIDLDDVEVWLYDRWAAEQARSAFGDIPKKESQDATAGVLQVKRHAALRVALETLVRAAPRRSQGRKARVRRSDLLHLFGDSALLEEVRSASQGAITPRMIQEVLAHTHVQFLQTTEEEYAHVDADRLQTVDGRSIDEGTPMQDARTIDVEDYAVLFELDRLRSQDAAQPLPRMYDCIVVDEAQELAPLELTLIGRALHAGGSLIVAGDAAQQVDPSACFRDWQTTMTELGARDHEAVTLEVSYRCPPEVTALARVIRDQVLDRAPAPPAGHEPAHSSALAIMRFDNECHLVAMMIDSLRALYATDPLATVAVICRTPDAARRLARMLGRGIDLRLALGGDFAFDAGINVTCVPEVKGLEFDYVVVPDASAAVYPVDAAARHALYVAVTRAVHQLVLASVGSLTPLLAHVAGEPGRQEVSRTNLDANA